MEIARLWFDFKGRLNRGKYWFITIANMLIFAAFLLTAVSVHSAPLGILAGLVAVPPFISALAVTVKRLHDRGKSAWWVLLFYILPIMLSGAKEILASLEGAAFAAAVIVAIIGTVISIWAFVEIGCLRGTRGPNRYGPDPLDNL
jgi:uncharacterized membrane protein YhaH (DUF805 family)